MKEKLLDFYSKHKKLVLIVGVVLVLVIVGMIGSRKEKVDWDELLLGSHLPEVKKGSIDLQVNNGDYLTFDIEDVKKSYYTEYKEACIDMGYTIDKEDTGDNYEAFNKDGYKLDLYYSSFDEIYVHLYAPEEMSEITWNTTGLGEKLPVPTSTYGKVSTDSSSTYRVLLGKTSLDEFNKYVESCQEKGFNIDYNKQEKKYTAKNSEGYSLEVSYEGNNVIDIMIEAPKEESSNNNSEETNNNNTTNNNTNNNNTSNNNTTNNNTNNNTQMVNGMRKDFKDAMDSYEKFMDEYIAFMKKYNANPSDLSLLTEYTKILDKYNKFVDDFDNWESDDLNTKEAAYYLEVQTRVNKKISEALG